MFDLPVASRVDRIIPKTKFYERVSISAAIRDEFTGIIGRITWLYKLAPNTLNIQASDRVEELQVFLVDLKTRDIPLKALGVIDKVISYPILYVLQYEGSTCYVIKHKLDSKHRYYKTEWNQLPELSFTGSNLEAVYQRIITSFIVIDSEVGDDKSFEEIITANTQREQLQKEIVALENKIRGERQFSKKVTLNGELQQKKHKLNQLTQ